MLEKLGIKKINWEFKFHPHGKSFQDTPLTIYADIGNQISGGVVDNHSSDYESSADVIQNNQGLILTHIYKDLHLIDLSKDEITLKFCTHHGPDLDSCVSFFLIDYLLKNGVLPEFSDELVKATNLVDQSKLRLNTNGANIAENECSIKSFVSLSYNHAKSKEEAGISRILESKEEILLYVQFNKVSEGNRFLRVSNDFAQQLSTEPLLKPISLKLSELEDDYKDFAKDLDNASKYKTKLPYIQGDERTCRKTALLVFNEYPSSRFFKFFARAIKDEENKETNFDPKYGAMLVPGK